MALRAGGSGPGGVDARMQRGGGSGPGAGAGASALRVHRRVFRADPKTSTCRVRWEVLKPPYAGGDIQLLWDLSRALRAAATTAQEHGELPKRPSSVLLALGARGVARAVQNGEAEAVLCCVEGVPAVLVQHVPVMCALRGIPVAMLAATPLAMLQCTQPILSLAKPRIYPGGIVVIALTKGCSEHPKLAALVKEWRTSLPPVQLPFLVPGAAAGSEVAVAGSARQTSRQEGGIGRAGDM